MKKIDSVFNVKNDGTIGYSLVKYMSEIANEKNMDMFSVFLVEKLILPYKKEDKILEWITDRIGFKKVPTIDKIYFRLKQCSFN